MNSPPNYNNLQYSHNNKTFNQKKISILDFLENYECCDRPNSPTTLKAIELLGYIPEEIKFRTFKEFLDLDPNSFSLPYPIQQRRYDLFNEIREEKINNIYDKRNELLESDYNPNQHSKHTSSNNESFNQRIMAQEQKEIERVKKKNEIDLKNELKKLLTREVIMKEEKNKERKKKLKSTKKEMEIEEEREEKERKRRERCKSVLEREKQKQQDKLDKYNERQLKFQIQKEENDRRKSEEEEKRKEEIMLKEEKRQQIIQKNYELIEERKSKIINKIEEKDRITTEQLKKKNEENEEKSEKRNEQFLKVQDRIQSLERQNQMKREQTLKDIMKRREDIEYRLNKINYNLRKRQELREDFRRKKQEYDNEFQKVFHSGKVSQNWVNHIHELFPDDPKINELLERLQYLNSQEQEDKENQKILDKELNTLKRNKMYRSSSSSFYSTNKSYPITPNNNHFMGLSFNKYQSKTAMFGNDKTNGFDYKESLKSQTEKRQKSNNKIRSRLNSTGKGERNFQSFSKKELLDSMLSKLEKNKEKNKQLLYPERVKQLKEYQKNLIDGYVEFLNEEEKNEFERKEFMKHINKEDKAKYSAKINKEREYATIKIESKQAEILQLNNEFEKQLYLEQKITRKNHF